ncbi:unnamed protein product [Lactuca saligna]|uniref:Uncharacterized protein n=1 Tax=Lactuca saligna TaxID=75948 RepID=A0AA35ZH47_LACSI|nr:unnamed protein product [Lactuca saligna]
MMEMMTLKKYNRILVPWEGTKQKLKKKKNDIFNFVGRNQIVNLRGNDDTNDTTESNFGETYDRNRPTHEELLIKVSSTRFLHLLFPNTITVLYAVAIHHHHPGLPSELTTSLGENMSLSQSPLHNLSNQSVYFF